MRKCGNLTNMRLAPFSSPPPGSRPAIHRNPHITTSTSKSLSAVPELTNRAGPYLVPASNYRAAMSLPSISTFVGEIGPLHQARVLLDTQMLHGPGFLFRVPHPSPDFPTFHLSIYLILPFKVLSKVLVQQHTTQVLLLHDLTRASFCLRHPNLVLLNSQWH